MCHIAIRARPLDDELLRQELLQWRLVPLP